MATYSNDFSQYPIAAGLPSDWTAKWVSTNTTFSVVDVGGGAKAMRVTSIGDARRLFVWNKVPKSRDANVLVKWRTNNLGAITDGWFPCRARCSDVWNTTAVTGYSAAVNNPAVGTTSQTIHRYTSGTSTYIGALSAWQPVVDAWMWTRLEVVGSTIRIKRWMDGSPEPSAWDVTATDTSITDVGLHGIGEFAPFTSGTYRDYGYFEVTATGWPNDFLANATEITGTFGQIVETDLWVGPACSQAALNLATYPNPTLELGEYDGDIFGSPGGHGSPGTRWWKWTSPTTATATVSTHGSPGNNNGNAYTSGDPILPGVGFDTVLDVYTSSTATPTIASLTLVGTGDDTDGLAEYDRNSVVEFEAEAGTTYYIRVRAYDTNDMGYLHLNWSASTRMLHFQFRADSGKTGTTTTVNPVWKAGTTTTSLGSYTSETTSSGVAPWKDVSIGVDHVWSTTQDNRVEISRTAGDTAHFRNVWIETPGTSVPQQTVSGPVDTAFGGGFSEGYSIYPVGTTNGDEVKERDGAASYLYIEPFGVAAYPVAPGSLSVSDFTNLVVTINCAVVDPADPDSSETGNAIVGISTPDFGYYNQTTFSVSSSTYQDFGLVIANGTDDQTVYDAYMAGDLIVYVSSNTGVDFRTSYLGIGPTESVNKNYGEFPQGYDYEEDEQDGTLGGVAIMNDGGVLPGSAYFAEQGPLLQEYGSWSSGQAGHAITEGGNGVEFDIDFGRTKIVITQSPTLGQKGSVTYAGYAIRTGNGGNSGYNRIKNMSLRTRDANQAQTAGTLFFNQDPAPLGTIYPFTFTYTESSAVGAVGAGSLFVYSETDGSSPASYALSSTVATTTVATFSDDFNRANSTTTAGSQYEVYSRDHQTRAGIESNRFVQIDIGGGADTYGPILIPKSMIGVATPDIDATVVIGGVASFGDQIFVYRMAANQPARLMSAFDSSSSYWVALKDRIIHMASGFGGGTTFMYSQNLVAGDTARFVIVGNNHKVYRNGTLIVNATSTLSNTGTLHGPTAYTYFPASNKSSIDSWSIAYTRPLYSRQYSKDTGLVVNQAPATWWFSADAGLWVVGAVSW